MRKIWRNKALKKNEIEKLKQKLRDIGKPDLPVKAISSYAGLKQHDFVGWLNGYHDLPESRLQKIEECLSSLQRGMI